MKKLWVKVIMGIKLFIKSFSISRLFVQNQLENLKTQLKKTTLGTKKWIKRIVLCFWQQVYSSLNKISDIKVQYGSFVFYISFLILISILLYNFRNELNTCYSTKEEVQSLAAFILNVGSALIGASAIVTSYVLFAMQVNIERLPHGLFRRLSDDWKLLGMFTAAFLLSIALTTLSNFVNPTGIILTLLLSFWALATIFFLFQCAYRRALSLINPLKQIEILKTDACKELQSWDKKARRIGPLLQQEKSLGTIFSSHDSGRNLFFMREKFWTDGATRALQYAISLAQRYAEQGDYEVSKSALDVIRDINAAYIKAKGKTFYTESYIEDPRANDNFINNTLKFLRQSVQVAISRRDEQQLEQIFRTMAALYQLYLDIDYPKPYVTKSHANIAAGYLTDAIKNVVPYDMPEVLVTGQRLMGQSAQQLLNQENLDDIAILSKEIELISCAGIAKENYYPVTKEGIQQLANLTLSLLRSKNCHIFSIVRELRRNVASVVKSFLDQPDTFLTRIHSYYLGPYYSSINTQSLLVQLKFSSFIILHTQNDEDTRILIGNIEQWADGMYEIEKDLLLAAIKARSSFTSDIIYWIIGVAEILFSISNASACDDYHKRKLRDHGFSLIKILSYIPANEDVLLFVESYGMTDSLFEAIIIAQNKNCNEIVLQIAEMLLSWVFKLGRYGSGSAFLEKGLCGLAAFALISGDKKVSRFKNSIARNLSGKFAPVQEIREKVAKRILEYVTSSNREQYRGSKIDMTIDQVEHQKLQPLLQEIATLLTSNLTRQ
jgi:hypothetical protein